MHVGIPHAVGVTATILTLAACDRFRPSPTRTTAQPAPRPEPASSMPARSTVRRLHSRADVRLAGPRVEARADDWLIEGDGLVAVVSAKKGTIIDFGPAGADDGLVSLEPTVFEELDEPASVLESVAPAADSRSVRIVRRMLVDPPLRLETSVYVGGGALVLESVAEAPERAILAATLGEIVGWGNERTWIEGHGWVTSDGSYTGDFIAREGGGVAYALAPLDAHVLGRFPKPEPGYDKSARTGERVETIAAKGRSRRRVVTLTAADGAIDAAVHALPRFARTAFELWALPRGLPSGAHAEISRCDDTPFEQTSPRREVIALPHGCWKVRLSAPGYAPGAWVSPDRLAAPEARPRAGMLRWTVRTAAEPAVALPARILVRGLRGTEDPNWGDDADDGASLEVIHADRDGQRAIPPGRYRVNVTRGYEYTAFETTIGVVADRTVDVAARLERVVDSRGWISADLHVHSIGSMDAPTPLDDRVRALAAAGVEVAVATDHNALTDYSETIARRGLGRWLTSMVGDEISTRGVLMGHFNVFPLAAGSDPPPYENIGPPKLLARARAAPPAEAKIAQINHPRMGDIGYLELLRFDPRDVARWHADSPLAETGFDAIEVFNGDHYARITEVERCLSDWYALLDAGIRMTATGNSDSHKITYHEAGTPRNLVEIPDDDPAHFDRARFVDAVRRGHVVVSSGPLVRLTVDGRGPGESVAPGERRISVTVDAAPWVDVTAVDLVAHGKKLQSFAVPRSTAARRFETTVTRTLVHGDWIVAVARGERPMDFLHSPGAPPFAFTNPVWIE